MQQNIITEEERPLLAQLSFAIGDGDLTRVKTLVFNYPGVYSKYMAESSTGDLRHSFAADAARKGRLEILKWFVSQGVDIHLPPHSGKDEGLIECAVSNNQIETILWLLGQGAIVSSIKDGVRRSRCLISAAADGHLELTKILVEHGAELNGLSNNGLSALDFATIYNHPQVADYLRSVGAKSAREIVTGDPTPVSPFPQSIRDHLAATLGPVDPLALIEIVPTVPLSIVRVVTPEQQVLVTDGLSNVPIPGGEDDHPQFMELMIRLPLDWPTDAEALTKSMYSWPIDAMRQIARVACETGQQLRPYGIISHGTPAQPFDASTQFDHFQVILPGDASAQWERPSDGELVNIYMLYPIYPQEAQYAADNGSIALLDRIEENDAPIPITIHRPPVV
jgi:hypothetical protein